MASFDSFDSASSEEREAIKYPLNRVAPILRRYIKVLRIDLDRLRRHKVNIERFQANSDDIALNREQVNARRTVEQVNSTIKQLDCTRSQIVASDLTAFDLQVKDIYQEAISAVEECLHVQGKAVQPSLSEERESSPFINVPGSCQPNGTFMITEADKYGRSLDERLITAPQKQVVLEADPLVVDSSSQESWQDLHTSLQELNSLIHDYAATVHEQREKVEQIDDNIESAAANINAGTVTLTKTAKLKAAMFPLIGMVIGGAVGGPVGLVAGIKLGGLAAVGGGLVGVTGGTFLKKRQDKISDADMQNLNKKGSQSLPDLTSEAEPPDVTVKLTPS